MALYQIILTGTAFTLFGGLIGLILTRRHYKIMLSADKKAKILSESEKKALKHSNIEMAKLDFPSLLNDMEIRMKLWKGHKHSVRLGIWINWICTILNKSDNIKRK